MHDADMNEKTNESISNKVMASPPLQFRSRDSANRLPFGSTRRTLYSDYTCPSRIIALYVVILL